MKKHFLDITVWTRVSSLVIFLASLAMPSLFHLQGEKYIGVPGWSCFLFGWLGIADGIVAWYANPLLLLSLALTKKNTTVALGLALVGLVLALDAFV